VAPGFIDIKTHSDFTLPYAPSAESKILQGVTTEVIGHCGFSLAPVLPGRAPILREYLAGFAPWIETRETSFAAYMDDFSPMAVNTIMQVGHNTLRLMTISMEERTPKDDEMATMTRLLDEGLAAGTLGLSSGLFTAPGSFARPDEIHALLRVVRRHGGMYATHLRSEAGAIFDAVDEAIEAAEASGVHVHIAHLKLSGLENRQRVRPLLDKIEAARRRGCASTATPIRTRARPILWGICCRCGCRRAASRLCWGGCETQPSAAGSAARSTSAALRASGGSPRGMPSASAPRGLGRGTPVGASPSWRGRAVSARSTSCATCWRPTTARRSSWSAPSTRPTCRRSCARRPHPRFYGTFPRVLGHYARDLALLSLPEAVRKMTGGPAGTLRLVDRGLLREGYRADVTGFDPATILDRATYQDPDQYRRASLP